MIEKWSIWARELERLWGNFTDLISRENKPSAINECYNYIYLTWERAWRPDKRGVSFLPSKSVIFVHPPKENNVIFCDALIPGLDWGVTQLDLPLNSWACAGFNTWENHRHVRKYNMDTGGFQSSTGYRKQNLHTFSGALNCFKSLDKPGTRI